VDGVTLVSEGRYRSLQNSSLQNSLEAKREKETERAAREREKHEEQLRADSGSLNTVEIYCGVWMQQQPNAANSNGDAEKKKQAARAS